MSKGIVHFDSLLSILVPRELHIQLVAIAYHMGKKGKYGKSARTLLENAAANYVESLKPSERRAYDEILQNVRIQFIEPDDLQPQGIISETETST